MGLVKSKQNAQITSVEILNQINRFGVAEDRNLLRHDTLRNVIKDELDEEILSHKILEKSVDSGGRPMKVYVLSYKQGKRVLLRESKTVRKAVIDYIEKLEEKFIEELPQMSEIQMIAKIADHQVQTEKRIEVLEQKFDSVVTLESGKQRQIQKAVAKRVYQRMDKNLLDEVVREYLNVWRYAVTKELSIIVDISKLKKSRTKARSSFQGKNNIPKWFLDGILNVYEKKLGLRK